LNACSLAVNCAGPSAWINAPAPATLAPKVKVSGPLPPLTVSEVQIKLSPAAKPLPAQLQGTAAHATAIKLPVPTRLPLTAIAPTDCALKVAPSTVASAPNCDQPMESFEACAP
jgi:hypothetical protein